MDATIISISQTNDQSDKGAVRPTEGLAAEVPFLENINHDVVGRIRPKTKKR